MWAVIRLVRALWVFGLIYVSYMLQLTLVRWLGEARVGKRWAKLHRRNAKRMYRGFVRLRGVYIKLGQILSLMGNFLPRAYADELEALQDEVPPQPYRRMARSFRRSMGRSPDEVYATFAHEPLAAASLGQVHEATTQAGERVAVKILYPNVATIIAIDLRVLGWALRVYRRFVPVQQIERVHEQLKDMLERETNYVNEPCPALKSLDDDGRVVYVGSLSKTLFPGLRLGFMVGPKALIDEARALRRLMVRHAPNNNQRTAALFLALGHHDTLIRRLHKAYRGRWEAMGAALDAHFPAAASIPSFGGTSFWVRGPEDFDSEVLAKSAAAQGILIEPGRINFGGRKQPRNFFRLGFSSIDEKKIAPGIAQLAGLIPSQR